MGRPSEVNLSDEARQAVRAKRRVRRLLNHAMDALDQARDTGAISERLYNKEMAELDNAWRWVSTAADAKTTQEHNAAAAPVTAAFAGG